MKHLTEEEMIEHYYSEDLYKADAEIHLQACRQCSQSYEELGKLLGSVRGPEPLPRSSDYGAQVWQSIQGALQPYQAKQKRSFFQWPQLAYAAACLLFLAGAFLAGRMWEHAHTKPLLATSTPQQTKERVVLFVLDNHLDRSERLLVQLNHAGAEGEQVDLPLRGEAQQLLTDNRLYRQSVAQSNDPLLTAALDHLERVLLEVANSPDELSAADIARIEQEMNTQGLLFQIRVLRTKVSEQKLNAQAIGKGATL
ncbi:MAG TPA: hypothetical protein VKH40_02255 [Alloacidobacterium sp.]|nr:hypothetical protein [Alloacidobacterium sp.]